MKKLSLHASLLAMALLATGVAHAQNTNGAGTATPATAAGATPGAIEGEPAKKIEIVTLKGEKKLEKCILTSKIQSAQAYREFQTLVLEGRQLRQVLEQLGMRHNVAITIPEREALQVRINLLSARLKEFNEKASKAYGYITDAQYIVRIHKARLYMRISDDDYNRLSESDRSRPGNITLQPVRGEDGKEQNGRFKFVTTIEGVEANEKFDADRREIQGKRSLINQYHEWYPQLSDSVKKKVDEEVQKTQAEVDKLSQEHLGKYKVTLIDAHHYEVEDCQLFLVLNEDLLKQVEAHNAKIDLGSTTKP